jgi:thiol-disulfide isomerase/thioredoxin
MEVQVAAAEAAHAEVLLERDMLQEKLDICRGDPSEVEQAAVELYEEVAASQAAWDASAARERLEHLQAFYPHTNAGRTVRRRAPDIAVFGVAVPPLADISWFGEEGSYGAVTVLYFLEEWCPFCRDELPIYQQHFAELQDAGVRVIGLTEITRTSTPEKLQALLTESGVTFPVGQVSGRTIHDALNVEGIPAAAVIVDGQVAWRGGAKLIDWERVAAAASDAQ